MRVNSHNHLLYLLQHHHHRKPIQQIHSQLTTNPSNYTKIPLQIWNTLLRHYSLGDHPQESIFLYKHLQMQNQHQPIFFDSFSYSFLIKACANSQQQNTGKQLHSLTFKYGFGTHVYVQTSLVNMYACFGWLGCARNVFDEMPVRNCVTWNVMITGFTQWGEMGLARELFNVMDDKNVVSWTGIIDGYVRVNQVKEAMSLFRTMVVCEGIRPSELTILAILPGVWNIGSLENCQIVHGYGEKSGFIVCDIRVLNSFIDAYAKCGSVESALSIFEGVSVEKRNLVSWTSIISCFAMHGMAKEAVDYFKKMEGSCVWPNRVTFLSILNACSHGGLVEEGLEFFRKMVDECGVVPDIKHYGCLVDMLGRAGRFEEAEKMALGIPNEIGNVVIWRTLLGACSLHGNVEMGEKVTMKILEIERGYGGDYVLLSNIFAGVGRYDDSERVRRVMDGRNVSKVTGLSFV